MSLFNKVTFLGRPTTDFVVKEVGEKQMKKALGTYAINDRKGNVEYVRCEAWGKTAEILEKLGKKGQQALVEGRLSSNSWKDAEGQGHYTLVVTIENIEVLGGKKSAKADASPTVDDEAYEVEVEEIDTEETPF